MCYGESEGDSIRTFNRTVLLITSSWMCIIALYENVLNQFYKWIGNPVASVEELITDKITDRTSIKYGVLYQAFIITVILTYESRYRSSVPAFRWSARRNWSTCFVINTSRVINLRTWPSTKIIFEKLPRLPRTVDVLNCRR